MRILIEGFNHVYKIPELKHDHLKKNQLIIINGNEFQAFISSSTEIKSQIYLNRIKKIRDICQRDNKPMAQKNKRHLDIKSLQQKI